MLFSQKWEEIYATSDQEAFFRAKYLLDGQGISFKTDLINNQLRLSFNNADGSRAALGRDGSVRDFYKILVKKEDREKARWSPFGPDDDEDPYDAEPDDSFIYADPVLEPSLTGGDIFLEILRILKTQG